MRHDRSNHQCPPLSISGYFGHDASDLRAMRKSLAWWQARPKLLGTRRGLERQRTLQRDIALHPETLDPLPF